MNKSCTTCGKEKPLSDFPRDARNRGGFGRSYACRVCMSEKRAAGYDLRSKSPADTLECSKCGLVKESADFYVGQWSYCKECSRKHPRKSVRPETRLKHNLKQYGLSPEEWRNLFSAQFGLCAICKNPESGVRRLSVDHDHATRKVRGLLCSNCNFGIGYLKESEETLTSAIAYLRGTKTNPTLSQHMKKILKKILKFLGIKGITPKRPRARKTTPVRIQVKLDTEGSNPYDADELRNHVKTHYVGDDCPGGHADLTDTCARPRVEQPKSDNNVTGPTS